jgi:hypothetical protein
MERKTNAYREAVPKLRRLVADFLRRQSGFQPRLGHEGFVVDKVALGQVFFKHFGFPCLYSFHRLLHTRHLPYGAGTVGQLVVDVPSGLSLTPPQETRYTLILQMAQFLTHIWQYGKSTAAWEWHNVYTPMTHTWVLKRLLIYNCIWIILLTFP